MLRSRLAVPICCLLLLALTVAAVQAALRRPRDMPPRVAAPGPALPEVVRAQRLELVDSRGNRWAELGLKHDGSRGLCIYDERGALRMEVMVKPSGSGVYVHEVRAASSASPSAVGEPRPPSGASPSPGDHSGLAPSSGS